MTLRTRAEIRAEFEEWEHYARYQRGPGQRKLPITGRGDERSLAPRDAAEWGADVLGVYLAENPSVHGTPSQIRSVASGFQAGGGREWGQMDPDTRQLSSVLINSASAELGTSQLGVDPALAEVAVESLADGRLTENEVESMCGMAGAVGGAVIGQAFGIPAPIGAFVGGLAGELVGGVVSGIFGLESGPTAREIARARAEATAREWERWQRDVRDDCTANAEAYVDRLDFAVRNLGQELDEVERRLGRRVRLIWTGAVTPSGYGGTYFDQLRRLGSTGYREYTTTERYAGTRQVVTHREVLCESPSGCIFPTVIRTGGDMSRSEREVANAMAIYGADWRPPVYQDRYQWFCSNWPTIDVNVLAAQDSPYYHHRCPPSGRAVFDQIQPELCDYFMESRAIAADPAAAMQKLVPAELLTQQAIVRAAAINQAQMEVEARRVELATLGARVRVSAWKIGRRRTWWANNGVLLGGAALLGYALWQAKKERRL
jgi:hypothetical protein